MSNARRRIANDRAAEQRARVQNAVSFWRAMRSHYPAEVAEAADRAQVALTYADLRAIEAAELVAIEELIAVTPSHKQRAVLRNASTQCRKNLRALVIAENPTLDLGAQPIVLPAGMTDEQTIRAGLRGVSRDDPRVRWLDALSEWKVTGYMLDALEGQIATTEDGPVRHAMVGKRDQAQADREAARRTLEELGGAVGDAFAAGARDDEDDDEAGADVEI